MGYTISCNGGRVVSVAGKFSLIQLIVIDALSRHCIVRYLASVFISILVATTLRFGMAMHRDKEPVSAMFWRATYSHDVMSLYPLLAGWNISFLYFLLFRFAKDVCLYQCIFWRRDWGW
jgi:hypothetical protein